MPTGYSLAIRHSSAWCNACYRRLVHLIPNHAKQEEHCIPLPSIHKFHHKGCYVATWQWVWKISICDSRAKPWREVIMQEVSHPPWGHSSTRYFYSACQFWGEINLLEHAPTAAELLILNRAGCSFRLLPTVFCAFGNEQTYMLRKLEWGCSHWLITWKPQEKLSH